MRPIIKSYSILLLIGLIALMSSCRRSPYYHHYETLPSDGWRADQEIFFSFSSDSLAQSMMLEGAIRLSPHFNYKHLPIGVVIESPSRQFETLTLDIDLSKPFAISQKGYTYHEVLFAIEPQSKLTERGVYSVSYRHLLNDSIVPGVVELGVIIREKR